MKTITLIFVLVLLSPKYILGQDALYVPGEILIKFHSGVLDSNELESDGIEFSMDSRIFKLSRHKTELKKLNSTKMKRVVKRLRPRHKYSISRSGEAVPLPDLYNLMLIEVPSNLDVIETCKILSKLEGIEYAEPNYILTATDNPNDPQFGLQLGFEQANNKDINASTAWNYSSGSSAIKIGILDTGIDYTHVDLGSVFGGSKVSGGWDYVNDDPNPYDDAGHGTACAGIAGAVRNNAEGVAGLAGGNSITGNLGCQLLAFKMLDNTGRGSVSNAVNAVIEASSSSSYPSFGYGCHVLSLSGSYYGITSNESKSFRNSVKVAAANEVIFVAATGNNGNTNISYPARFDDNLIIAVGASNKDDQRANFSNYGVGLDVIAPGTDDIVYTTKKGGGYRDFDGTSAATPHVAGLVGLVKSFNPNLWAEDVQGIIKASATKVAGYSYDQLGWNNQVGHGRIDAGKAMQMLQSPWSLDHYTVAGGGTTVAISSQYNMEFDAYATQWVGLPAGEYKVKQYRVQKTVSFPARDESKVWGSGIKAQIQNNVYYPIGYNNTSSSQVNYGLGYTNVVSYTSSTATLENYVYEVWSANGSVYYGFMPTSPQNVYFAYTVLGLVSPPLSGYIEGPDCVTKGQNGTWFADGVSGGIGSYSYQWKKDGTVIGTGSSVSQTVNYNFILELIITSGIQTITRSTNVTVCSGGGGCPYIFAETENGLVADNNILHRSEFKVNRNKSIQDLYKLNVVPTKTDNVYRLQIKELNSDHSYFDGFNLYAVDHTPGNSIAITEDNRIVSYNLNGMQLADEIEFEDGKIIQTELNQVDVAKSEIMHVKFSKDKINRLTSLAKSKGSQELALLIDFQSTALALLPPKEEAGRIPDNSMLTKSKARNNKVEFARREQNSQVLIPLNEGIQLDDVVIEWNRASSFGQIGIVPITEVSNSKQLLKLRSANHSKYGDVLLKLNNVDRKYAELDSAETIDLTFEALNDPNEKLMRSFVLETNGYYVVPGEAESTIPKDFGLEQNYPNPFNPTTTIRYNLKENVKVTLTIYNTLGQVVKTLVDADETAGIKNVIWDGTDNFGKQVASGIYFYKLNAGKLVFAKKMLFIK